MMKRMLGFRACCCCCGCCATAGVLAGPEIANDMSVVAPISAAHDLACQPDVALRRASGMLGGLILSMQSNIISASLIVTRQKLLA